MKLIERPHNCGARGDASLDLAYRITAFVGIGIVFFASSAWYTHSLKMQHIESAA